MVWVQRIKHFTTLVVVIRRCCCCCRGCRGCYCSIWCCIMIIIHLHTPHHHFDFDSTKHTIRQRVTNCPLSGIATSYCTAIYGNCIRMDEVKILLWLRNGKWNSYAPRKTDTTNYFVSKVVTLRLCALSLWRRARVKSKHKKKNLYECVRVAHICRSLLFNGSTKPLYPITLNAVLLPDAFSWCKFGWRSATTPSWRDPYRSDSWTELNLELCGSRSAVRRSSLHAEWTCAACALLWLRSAIFE